MKTRLCSGSEVGGASWPDGPGGATGADVANKSR